MANEYLYGAYGHIGETVAQSAVQAGTTPVYIGTAPVNLVRGFADAGVINEPIKLSNMIDAQRKLGYAADWGTFTLCEVMNAHFNNTLGNIGPIYVINVLDPSEGKHRKATETTQQLSFAGGRAEFASSTIILDTLTIAKSEGGDYVEGTDYAVDYNFTKGTVIITSLIEDSPLTGNLTASFYEVDDSAIEDDDVIGGVTASGEYSGLSAIALLYPEQFAVCNLIAAPGWSQSPAVYNAMLTASQKINGHWDAFVVADLPLVDSSAQAVDTITKAIAWKKNNAFTGERSKVYWPQGIDNLGNVYHLSTLAVVELMRADFSHNSVPMETCGNKAIPIIKQYFGANATNRGFSQQEGKELTQNGISTAVAWGGEWVLWGDHTAAYTYGADVDPRAIFDVSMRMLMHITNDFQREWSPKIDEPMTRALKDEIINREQEKLDGYVSMGALLGEPKIVFLESENSTTDIMNGDFRWDIAVTPTPPLKSATVYVAYTDAGFSVYYEGGDE
jgi:phage tail sheath protein FI